MENIKKAIEYILFESSVSKYRISKETGISQPLLTKYSKGVSNIENMTFGNAIKLYNFYLSIKEEINMNIELLKAKVTDKRIVITESKGIYYADVVEERGDKDRLAQAKDIDGLYEKLKSFGVAE